MELLQQIRRIREACGFLLILSVNVDNASVGSVGTTMAQARSNDRRKTDADLLQLLQANAR